LIALIINARRPGPFRSREGQAAFARTTLRRADSDRPSSRRSAWKDQCHTRTARRRRGQASPALRLIRTHRKRTFRATLLFTMSAKQAALPTGILQIFVFSTSMSSAREVAPALSSSGATAFAPRN
jgi:hypothetical protein